MHVPQVFVDHVKQPAHSDQTVWRDMNFAKFVWMISRKQLWFSPLSLFEDKFEGEVPAPMLARAYAYFERRGSAEPDYAHHLAELKKLKQRFYVSCWHLAERESRRMWEEYCGARNGVVLKTTYERLKASVAGLPIGLVEYIEHGNFQDPKFGFKPLYSAWLKLPKFTHENEVRIGFFDGWVPGWPPGDGKIPIGGPIAWSPESAFNQISVYPGADYSYVEAVSAVLEQWAPTLAQRVAWSEFGARSYESA
jgi:hypothetical protein